MSQRGPRTSRLHFSSSPTCHMGFASDDAGCELHRTDAQRRLPYPCLLGTNSFLLGRFMSCFVPEYNDPLLQNTASTDAGCELHRTRCSATLARVPYSSLVDFWLSMPVQSSLTQLPTGVNKTTLSLQNFKLALRPFNCFCRAN